MKKLCPLFSTKEATRLAALPLALGLIGGSLYAQRVHVGDSPPGSGQQGLIGEPPDTSTWPHPAAPDGNPFPRSSASIIDLVRRDNKILLGKSLFWEEQVGVDSTMACGTCHDPGAAGADGRGNLFPHSAGTFGSAGVIAQAAAGSGKVEYGFLGGPTPSEDRLVTPIIAPPMIGAYIFSQLFWDMRAGPDFPFEGGGIIPGFSDWAACEELSTGPPLSPVEMGHEALTWSSNFLQKKIGNSFPMALCDPDPANMPLDFRKAFNIGGDYNWWFDKVFSSDPNPTLAIGPGVTRERFAAAVAHYMRTLIPDQAPIDVGTMTVSQQNGMAKLSSVGCFGCHSVGGGVALFGPGGKFVDPFDSVLSDGRFHNIRGITVKTPSLRNIGLKHRFFTDGQVDNFPDLLAFYQSIFGFTLTMIETAEVTDFLAVGLLDNRVAARLKPFDKPVLASERPEHVFESNEFGTAIAGFSSPEIIANSPAYLPPPGSPVHFKVGVANCIPGATARLEILVPPSTVPIFMASTTVNGAGFATTFVSLPLTTISPSGAGPMTFIGRWSVKDPGAPLNLAKSNSARWTTFNF